MKQSRSTASRLGAAVRYHQAGDFEKAEKIYKKVLSRSPLEVDALHLMGVLAHQTGRQEHAAKYVEKAISINSSIPDFHLSLGNIFQATGQYERALGCYKNTLSLNPGYPMAFNNMANTLLGMDRPEDAVEVLEKAVSVFPGMPVLYNTLGLAYRDLEKYDLAREHLETALRLDPTLLAAWINTGTVYQKLGRVDKALECYERALEMDPNRFQTHFNLGNLFQESGEFERAVEYYQAALKLNPSHVKSIYNTVYSRKYDSVGHADHAYLSRMLNDPGISNDDRIHLHFAVAKLLNDCGDYDGAFSHYDRANHLVECRFDRNLHERFVSRLISTYDSGYFSRPVKGGANSRRPVFIVGMPRSGTTLVEQILCCHPQVAGGGELLEIPWLVQRISAELRSSSPYPECMLDMDEASAARLAQQFMNHLDLVSATAERVTDKLPTNFLHLGLIVNLFPKATIIHCRRNSMDTCLSCYFQNFSRELNFTFDLSDLGFYYRHYERVMEHWNNVLPAPIFEVQYEELTENPEAFSRALISACGLQWDDRCLRPHQNRRAVKTASSWQVRQPVYKTSIARWTRYEKHLSPLKAALAQPTN